MEDGLAVVGDEINLFEGGVEFFGGGDGGFGVDVAEAGVELAEFGGGKGILFGDAEDFFADCGGERLMCVVQEIDFQIWRGATDFD